MVVETVVHEICACDCSWTRKEYFPRRELDDAMSSASNYLNILNKRKTAVLQVWQGIFFKQAYIRKGPCKTCCCGFLFVALPVSNLLIIYYHDLFSNLLIVYSGHPHKMFRFPSPYRPIFLEK